jgi:hypothetical protein
MKFKRIIVMITVVALLGCFAAVPAGADGGSVHRWIEITERQGQITGVCFQLSDFVAGAREVLAQAGRNAEEGFYQFHFIAQSVNPTQAITYKVVTQHGNMDGNRPTIPNVRFTTEDQMLGEVTKTTFWLTSEGSDSRDYGRIPAADTPGTGGNLVAGIITMGVENKELALISNDEHSFTVRGIIVEHFLTDDDDETGLVVYNMLEDPLIQNAPLGSRFTQGSMGLTLTFDNADTNFELIGSDGSRDSSGTNNTGTEPGDNNTGTEPGDNNGGTEPGDNNGVVEPPPPPPPPPPPVDPGDGDVFAVILMGLIAILAVVAVVMIFKLDKRAA